MANKQTQLQIVIDAVNRAGTVFGRIGADLDAIKTKTEHLRSGMQAVGTAGTIAFGGLAFLTKGIIQAGAGFEQTQIAFETMLGSAEQARKTLADLSKFAAATPFELPQLEEAAKRLLAYGTTAEDLLPTLKMLGDISAGVGMDKLPQLTLAFGQVRAATKLTGAELRQFSEAGVPLLGALATQLGRTEAEIIEMVSAGEVGFAEVRNALAALTGEGGKFFNLMAQQSGSLGGLWSTLRDELSLTARTIGTELLPYLKPTVERLIAMTKAVGDFVNEHPRFTANLLIGALALTAFLAILLPIAMALPGLILMFQGITAAIGFVAAAFGAVTLPMLTTVLLLGIVGVTAFKVAAQWQDAWGIITIAVAESANFIQTIIEGVMNFIVNAINGLINKVNSLLSALSALPIVGKQFSKLSIPTLDPFAMERFDTGSIYNDMMARPSSRTIGDTFLLNIFGNNLFDEDSAEKIGDLLMQRLKLSNPL